MSCSPSPPPPGYKDRVPLDERRRYSAAQQLSSPDCVTAVLECQAGDAVSNKLLTTELLLVPRDATLGSLVVALQKKIGTNRRIILCIHDIPMMTGHLVGDLYDLHKDGEDGCLYITYCTIARPLPVVELSTAVVVVAAVGVLICVFIRKRQG